MSPASTPQSFSIASPVLMVWVSYYETNRVFNELNPNRSHTNSMERPMALTKFAGGRHGNAMPQHPAAHRYPVWYVRLLPEHSLSVALRPTGRRSLYFAMVNRLHAMVGSSNVHPGAGSACRKAKDMGFCCPWIWNSGGGAGYGSTNVKSVCQHVQRSPMTTRSR